MKNFIKVKCPAKINLTLEIVNRRDDGFHNIKSVMQLISLYDFLTIKISTSNENKISLSGNNLEIPYNEKNLVYKAAKLYLERANLTGFSIDIYIKKNIPVAAGLAGGSTDAAGTLWGLNQVYEVFSQEELNSLCAELGSDLNVCLNGGCTLATSRGEITQKLPMIKSPVTLIKPKKLGISAGEAYKKYALKEFKPQYNMTEKMLEALNTNQDIKSYLYNDLEYAVFDDYPQLQKIKIIYPQAIMSGSGSTYFLLEKVEKPALDDSYEFFNDLSFITEGVSEA